MLNPVQRQYLLKTYSCLLLFFSPTGNASSQEKESQQESNPGSHVQEPDHLTNTKEALTVGTLKEGGMVRKSGSDEKPVLDF